MSTRPTSRRKRSSITSAIFLDLLNGRDHGNNTEAEEEESWTVESLKSYLPHAIVWTIFLAWLVIFTLLVINTELSNHILVASGSVFLAGLVLIVVAFTYETPGCGKVEPERGTCLEDMVETVKDAEECKRALEKLMKDIRKFDNHFLWLYQSGLLLPDTEEFRSWRVSVARYRALRG